MKSMELGPSTAGAGGVHLFCIYFLFFLRLPARGVTGTTAEKSSQCAKGRRVLFWANLYI